MLQLTLHDVLPHILRGAVKSILDELQQCMLCLSFDVMLDLFELVDDAIVGLDVILNLNVLADLLLYYKFIQILIGL